MGEGSLHIEDARPDTDHVSLSDSTVNVEEEELHRDADGLGVGGAEGSSEQTKVELPEELLRSVVVVRCESEAEGGSCDVYLVGVPHRLHGSPETCRKVEAIVRLLKPQVVFLGSCSREVLQRPAASKLEEASPRDEFRVAFREATKYGGKVIIGDRPLKITLRRAWTKTPIWHISKFLYYLMFQADFLPSPEELDEMLKDAEDEDMLTLLIQAISKEFPTLMDTIVHERGQYMASELLSVAGAHSSVVAVVGRGDLQGIKRNWQQPITISELIDIPTKRSAFSATGILASLAVAAVGLYLARKR